MSAPMTHYLYLHGFASSPQSRKAQFLRQQFRQVGHPLQILDLNQDDFTHLTLSRQIQQSQHWIQSHASARDRVVVIGSSFGGLTAAWLAQQPAVQAAIEKLVLLAPAFQFLPQWLPRLGAAQLQRWQTEGYLSIYHYGANQALPLAYDFVTDAQRYDEARLSAPVPTLILHGCQDTVISIQSSRNYAATRPWVQLVALDDDHALTAVQDQIWQRICQFLNLTAGA